MRVRVAVEALTGRSAAEVGVTQKRRLARGVAQALLCLDVWAHTRQQNGELDDL